MRRKWLVLLIVLFSTLALAGCGSGGGGGSEVTDGGGDIGGLVETVGTANCLKCHSPNSPETFTWLMSAHANPNESPGRSGPAGPDSECAPCHNQLQEGQLLPDIFAPPYNVAIDGDTTADVARNIVVCESCHGGGSAHRGIGPIPYARPDWEQCVACHDYEEGVDGDRTEHIENWGKLASSVGASAHNNSDDLHASTTRCQRCHTAEGSVELAQYTGDADVMHLMDDLDPVDLEENLHPVTCAACHVPHSDELRADTAIVLDYTLDTVTYNSAWDPNNNTVADQFDFCTSCHTYYNQDGTLIGSGSVASGTAPHYHNTSWYRVIPSTHYDDPTTGFQNTVDSNNVLVEGYVMRQTINGVDNESVCFDCHGHEFRTNTRLSRDEGDTADYGSTIHTQWASSGHAGGLLGAKYEAADANPITGSRGTPEYETTGTAQVDAVMMTGASDDTSDGGFTHYDWDTRAACQMCHTATGAANFMDNPAGYVAANNDFTHLTGEQNELLYCWGCHTNAGTGALRTPGPITLAYTNLDGLNPVMPDYGNSNVCINCHSGRGGMDSFLGVATADPAGAAITGGTRTHYYAAGATINQELTNVGYMYYNSALYADQPYFAHNTLGCAECHMSTDESHTYMVVEKDASDTITAIKSGTCVECHDGEHALFVADSQIGTSQQIWNGTAAVATTVTQAMADDAAAEMEHESHGYHNALEALGVALTGAGTTPSPNYPYFVGSATDQGHGGAMHNYSYLHHEPGGYAHNRYYVKRLIFDSIDWLTDSTTGAIQLAGSRSLDGVIFADPSHPDGMAWLDGDSDTPGIQRP